MQKESTTLRNITRHRSSPEPGSAERFIRLHVHRGMCVCVCVVQDSTPCSHGDAVILCKSIFLEWVLLIPPLYD